MKWNRIVKYKTDKRSDRPFLIREMAAGLLFVFLLPYVCACLFGQVGEDTPRLCAEEKQEAYEAQIRMEWGTWRLPMEEYLVYQLAGCIPESYEPECMKAQAVLLRTDFMRKAKEQDTPDVCVDGAGMERWYRMEAQEEALDRYRSAVEETAGIYLCYEGKPILAPYFQISSGQTRNVGEVWGTEKYPYLSGAVVTQDRAAAAYENRVVVSKERYLALLRGLLFGENMPEKSWEEPRLCRDSAQYVTQVEWDAGGTVCDGETFRRAFGLPSAAFEMEMGQTEVTFCVSGSGHGFGMSQYGANGLAVNGENYGEILKYFFQGTELAKIE